MLRFAEFERLGLRLACMSDASDGDCATRPENAETRRAFVAAAGMAATPCSPRQVHGTRVWYLDAMPEPETEVPEADTVLTNLPGLPIGVTVADCVPVFLYAPDAGAGGVVHAGRVGTLKGITAATVDALRKHYGAAAGEIHALIGPSAGPCCYEVSTPMAQEFHAQGFPVRGRHLDLWAANRLQLEAAGVPPEHITLVEHCTICGQGAPVTAPFHSYRRTGTSARNLAVLVL